MSDIYDQLRGDELRAKAREEGRVRGIAEADIAQLRIENDGLVNGVAAAADELRNSQAEVERLRRDAEIWKECPQCGLELVRHVDPPPNG